MISSSPTLVKKFTFIFAITVMLLLPGVSGANTLHKSLSPVEKQWLIDHPRLKLGVGIAFPPFMWVEREGEQPVFRGMVSDYVTLLSEKLGVEMEVVFDIPFNRALKRGKHGEIDLFPCLSITRERSDFLLFTRPYLSYPQVIITREDAAIIGRLDDLAGKNIAAVKHLMVYSKLHQEYQRLNLNFVFKDTVEENLAAVSLGSADACILNLAVASYFIQKNGFTNLRVAAPVDWQGFQFAMGVKKEFPMLQAIVQKALDSISQEEKDRISQHWIRLKYQAGVQIGDLILWASVTVLVFAAIVSLFLLWNRRLQNEISEKEAAEMALRENKQKTETLIGNLPGAAYSCSGSPDWTMGYLSQGCRLLTGHDPSDLIGNTTRSYNDLIVPEDREYVTAVRGSAVTKDEPYALEYRIRDRNGSEKWIWEKGQRVRNLPDDDFLLEGFITDISERKEAVAELERLRMAIEQSGETIVITDSQGVIQFVNKAFERETGYTRHEAIGRNPRILKSDEHETAFYENLWSTISSGGVFQGRIINRHKNGSLFTEFATISPVFNDEGKIVNYVAVKRDITDYLQMEQQLRQSQKMESIGQLAGGVAHDYNNMLSVIIGYTELAMEQTGGSGKLYRDLHEIRKAAVRSADITRQLLAFARKQTVVPEVLDINDVVVNILKMLQRLIGENIKMSWQPVATAWKVEIDPTQLEQILANLCVNASHAIRTIGSIVIETEKTTLDQHFCAQHPGASPGEYMLLMVTDDGCGIAEDDLQNIFEPFFTTREQGEGTGLGLATVYGIVKQNNGYIDVTSEPGKGTTFRIFLPRHLQKGSGTDATPITITPPKGRGETILLVEDDPATLKLTRRLLKKLEYRVLEATTPNLAMTLFHQDPAGIELLLTDVIMPKMNGRELATRMQSSRPELKVVYMSGYTADIITRQGVLVDGVNFLQKPFNKMELALKLEHVLKGNSQN